MAKLVSLGYDNNVNVEKIVAIVRSTAAPSRRAVRNAKDKDMLVDATNGGKTASVIIMESGHVVISTLKAETIRKRSAEL